MRLFVTPDEIIYHGDQGVHFLIGVQLLGTEFAQLIRHDDLRTKKSLVLIFEVVRTSNRSSR